MTGGHLGNDACHFIETRLKNDAWHPVNLHIMPKKTRGLRLVWRAVSIWFSLFKNNIFDAWMIFKMTQDFRADHFIQVGRTGQTGQFCQLPLNFSSLCYFFSFCGELLMGFLVFSSISLDHLFAERACRSDQLSPCFKIPWHDKTAKLNCAFCEYSDHL